MVDFKNKLIKNNMKKTLLIMAIIVLAVIFVILLIGVYRFNFTSDDIYVTTGGKINSKDATYIINGQAITFKNGVSELITTPDSATKIITRYFGNDVTGDLNGDGQDDVAFLLTQDNGGSGTFYYVTVALAGDQGYRGLNAALLGDRIAPQTIEIKDGKIIVNYAERQVGEPMSIPPSVGVSKYLQVINNKLEEIGQPNMITNLVEVGEAATQIANPASTNCIKLGGNLVIEKRGDGSEYGLCYFEDNRACEEWALLRGACPVGGVKTTGFDTIDQKYCAWSGGETFAVPQSICTFKDGTKCPTLEFYNGTCPVQG